MEFTKKQLKDLETVEYFIPKVFHDVEITNEDRKIFFESSERGLHGDVSLNGKYIGHKDGVGALYEYTGFQALMWGKIWRGRHIHEMYEPGILEGFCYIDLLENMPTSVINFLKREMFQGIDAGLIEELEADGL